MSCRRAPWSDLPSDLLHKITEHLNTDDNTDDNTQIIHLRAVCRSWRSMLPPPQDRPPIRLPFPFSAYQKPKSPEETGAYLNLIERRVYLLRSQETSWVAKVEKSEQIGNFRILNLMNDNGTKIQPHHAAEIILPKVLDTLRFRIFELCKAYDLEYINPSNPDQDNYDRPKYAKKVVVSLFVINGTDEFSVVAIDQNRNLWCTKSGANNWSTVYPSTSNVDDVLFYRRQLYTICYMSPAIWIYNSSLELFRLVYFDYPPQLGNWHLVELQRKAFLAVGMLKSHKRECKCIKPYGCTCKVTSNAVATKLYMIHDRLPLVEEKKLNDQIILLGDDCSFSVPAKEARVFDTDRFICVGTKARINEFHSCEGSALLF